MPQGHLGQAGCLVAVAKIIQSGGIPPKKLPKQKTKKEKAQDRGRSKLTEGGGCQDLTYTRRE